MPARWLKVVAGCRDRWVDILSARAKKVATKSRKDGGFGSKLSWNTLFLKIRGFLKCKVL